MTLELDNMGRAGEPVHLSATIFNSLISTQNPHLSAIIHRSNVRVLGSERDGLETQFHHVLASVTTSRELIAQSTARNNIQEMLADIKSWYEGSMRNDCEDTYN